MGPSRWKAALIERPLYLPYLEESIEGSTSTIGIIMFIGMTIFTAGGLSKRLNIGTEFWLIDVEKLFYNWDIVGRLTVVWKFCLDGLWIAGFGS